MTEDEKQTRADEIFAAKAQLYHGLLKQVRSKPERMRILNRAVNDLEGTAWSVVEYERWVPKLHDAAEIGPGRVLKVKK